MRAPTVLAHLGDMTESINKQLLEKDRDFLFMSLIATMNLKVL